MQAMPERAATSIFRRASTIPASRSTSIANAPASSASPPRTSSTTSSRRSRPTAWSRPATGSIRRAATTTWSRCNTPISWINHMSMEDLREHSPARHAAAGLQPMDEVRQASPMAAALFRDGRSSGYDHARLGGQHPPDQHAYRSRSQPDSPRDRRLRGAQNRSAAERRQRRSTSCSRTPSTTRTPSSTCAARWSSMNEAFRDFGLGLIIADRRWST